MPATIRLATATDAPRWLDLLKSTLGTDYPAKEIYDPVWIARELEIASGHETWVAEVDGRPNASIPVLKPPSPNATPTANPPRPPHPPSPTGTSAANPSNARFPPNTW